MVGEFLEVREGYRITIQNRCTWLGCYASEDDWTESYVAPSMRDCIDAFWKAYPMSNIIFDYGVASRVLYVIYNKFPVVVSEVEPIDFPREIFFSLRGDAQEKRDAIIKKRKDAESDKFKRDQIRQEKQLLADLQKKYGKEKN